MRLTSCAHDYCENVHIAASSYKDLSICLLQEKKRKKDKENDKLLSLIETNLYILLFMEDLIIARDQLKEMIL